MESLNRDMSVLFPKGKKAVAEETRQKILDMAKKACSDAGGYALINNRYAFIDVTKYRAVYINENEDSI